jgi:hypothetical protein
MIQLASIAIASVCAMFAMPVFYEHRMDRLAFAVGVLAFTAVPLIAGIIQGPPHRAMLPIAALLLLLCPVAFFVTDPLPVRFERLRDAYFLAAFNSIVFIASLWLANSIRSRRWVAASASALSVSLAAAGVYVLLALVMFLE